MAVTAIADQVHNYVAAESITIFEGYAADTHYRIHVFTIDVEDGDGLPSRDLCCKT